MEHYFLELINMKEELVEFLEGTGVRLDDIEECVVTIPEGSRCLRATRVKETSIPPERFWELLDRTVWAWGATNDPARQIDLNGKGFRIHLDSWGKGHDWKIVFYERSDGDLENLYDEGGRELYTHLDLGPEKLHSRNLKVREIAEIMSAIGRKYGLDEFMIIGDKGDPEEEIPPCIAFDWESLPEETDKDMDRDMIEAFGVGLYVYKLWTGEYEDMIAVHRRVRCSDPPEYLDICEELRNSLLPRD